MFLRRGLDQSVEVGGEPLGDDLLGLLPLRVEGPLLQKNHKLEK